MLAEYKRSALIAWAVFLVGVVIIFIEAMQSENNPQWEPGISFIMIGLASGISYYIGFWAYGKAKGYPRLGLFLAFFFIVGLICLFLMPNKNTTEYPIPTTPIR